MLGEICALALTGAIAALVLSEIKGRLSFAVRIGTIIVSLVALVAFIAVAVEELSSIVGRDEKINEYASIVLRALGVALIGHFVSLVCKELGSESLSFCVELAARAEIFLLCLPLIKEIMGVALAILEI